MKALVLGATGAIGKDLVSLLLQDEAFDRVDIFVRREVPASSDKLVVHVVDFDHPEQWAGELTGDVLFSTLGTTIRAAGSQPAQWKVDYTYQLQAAQSARKNGVPVYALVSSVGADAKSMIFYSKMKGALDRDVQALGFEGCFILRPPSLIRKGSDRLGEKIGVVALRAFNAIGLMRNFTPMPTEAVAAAMIRLAKSGRKGTGIFTSQEILSI
jgi:uncharacterized protein YbjT (DUF2867 family)